MKLLRVRGFKAVRLKRTPIMDHGTAEAAVFEPGN